MKHSTQIHTKAMQYQPFKNFKNPGGANPGACLEPAWSLQHWLILVPLVVSSLVWQMANVISETVGVVCYAHEKLRVMYTYSNISTRTYVRSCRLWIYLL